MNEMERNKALMRRFETMINTADEALAEELVANDAPFYTHTNSFSVFSSSFRWITRLS